MSVCLCVLEFCNKYTSVCLCVLEFCNKYMSVCLCVLEFCNKYSLSVCVCVFQDFHRSRLTDGEEVVCAALGLLMNVSVEPGQCVRQFGQRACEHCLRLCRVDASHASIVDRSLGLAGHVLPHCVPAVEWACAHSAPHVFLQHILVSCLASARRGELSPFSISW